MSSKGVYDSAEIAERAAAEERAQAVRAGVGHPGEKWNQLQAFVQDQGIERFTDVQDQWLDLLWALDAYREAGVPPSGMGDPRKPPAQRLSGIYRGKGNWFATLVALLLENQTSHTLAPRIKVQGFSQLHQIDVAWPARSEDPLICAETKLTGAPAYGSTPARGALSDWSNRRKELKFAATDLKLYRRQAKTKIQHWDVWRGQQPPKTYFLWAARLSQRDRIEKMTSEAQALVNTYLEGAGVFVFRPASDDSCYLPVRLPHAARVTDLDDVLQRIASEIAVLAGPSRTAPPPQVPEERAVDVTQLVDDQRGEE